VKERARQAGLDTAVPFPFLIAGTPRELVWHINVDRTEGRFSDDCEASWPETNPWRLSATVDVRGVTTMQPELYFYEQWLRERHADIQAAVRAARLRPQQNCAARDVDPNPVKEVQVASIEEPDAVPVWKDIGSSFLKLRDFLWRARHDGNHAS
jgi:hypothetical protein